MVLDVTHLEKAATQLEKSLGYLGSDMARADADLREQFRAAAIQGFEFTYELAIKMLRRQLEQVVAHPAELRAIPFMDLVRTGAEAGLVREPARFRLYREKRNITSHTYDAESAEAVVSVLPSFLDDVRYLLQELLRRNPPENAR